MRFPASAIVLLASSFALSCTDNEPDKPKGEDKTDRITAAIRFLGATVEEGPLPDATDVADILPLEKTVLLEPGEATIMALEVNDPKDREVEAILLQFEDEDEHQRVALEGGGAAVQSELELEEQLCDDRCDTAYVVTLLEAVELEDGSISKSSSRKLVIDCRKTGNPDRCVEGEKDDEDEIDQLLCGDVTQGETVISGDSVIDIQLEAVRLLSDSLDKRKQAVEMATQAIAESLGLASDSAASAVAGMLASRVSEQTESGLMLRLGDRGCAIRLLRVSHALRACDPEGGGELGALQCSGVCEPATEGSCDGDVESQGCRGILVDADCDGVCAGACETQLDSPATCAGTCTGSCDGECADDGNGGCKGPCSGLCTGTCRALNDGTCAGMCTGLCDAPSEDAEPECDAPLHAYCSAPEDGELGCNGDCFGGAALESGDETCQVGSLAIGRIAPRCEPPLIQLAFGFAAELPAEDQTALAEAVDDLNAPIAALVTEGDRLDLLATAASDLRMLAEDEINDRLASSLAEDPEDSGLLCADTRLPESNDWLDEQLTVIEDLRADVTALLAPLSVIE